MEVSFNLNNQNILFASRMIMSDKEFHAKEKSLLPLIDDRFERLNCSCGLNKAMKAKINLNKVNILLAEK